VEIVLGVLLVAALAALGFAVFKWREAAATRSLAAEEKVRLDGALAALQQQVRALARYQAILDAEATAAQVRGQAQREAADTTATARRESDGLLADARSANARTEASAQAMFSQASIDASKMIEAARARFTELTGEASAALQNAKQLEQTAQSNAQALATQFRAQVERDAAEIVAKAQRDGEALLAQARAGYAAAEASARAMHNQASVDANTMVEGARVRATDLAREAFVAMQNAQQLEATAKANAEALTAQLRGQVEREMADLTARVRSEADGVVAEARNARASAEVSARATLAQAASEANKVVEAAKLRAEEIAGEALAAMRDTKRLEKTAQAMKNVIEGYGDRYVIPTFGLLDDLAAEFGFAEAGQRLKAARERMREMIKQGIAANCDYVEQNRKTTAIEFVLDAFNGKVDTALAGVRHDNFGTLKEKINDAFMIVNNNGRAFRDARIEPAFLDTRQDELRWAVVAQELKAKDREEQRIIKERIREEERAQRDYDRAIKEAEKEEDVIRKAMAKALRDVEKASDDQKAKFEEQLRELTAKLQVAEEKNQRAISMAQQTKTGNVYVISNVGSFGENVYKIGMTRRLEPLDRVRELGDASVPFAFDVHAMIPSQDAPALEHALHKRFVRSQMNKVNPRKEFFRLSLQEVREEIDHLGCKVQWTIAAECREFRETQAIERDMASKTFDEQAWLKDQAVKEKAIRHEVEEAEEAV
jgi:hypothetical protein